MKAEYSKGCFCFGHLKFEFRICFGFRISDFEFYRYVSSPLIFLMILGMNNEKTNNPIEKNTLNEISSAQLPEAQISFSVPIKKVKIKVPTIIPRPVPEK